MISHKIPYQPFDRFLLRTPALPFDQLAMLLKDPDLCQDIIPKLWSDDFVKEAVFLASPDLYRQLEQFKGQLPQGKDFFKLASALLRYYARMSYRSTPFGLFAGINLGTWNDQNQVKLNSHLVANKHSRLDMYYLGRLAHALGNNTRIQNQLLYFPNASIYEAGDALRYIEYRHDHDPPSYHIVEVNDEPYIRIVLEKSRVGATKPELIKCLADKGYNNLEAVVFIQELIDNQMIISELEPSITGKTFLDRMIEILQKMNGAKQKIQCLLQVRENLQQVRKGPDHPAIYREIKKELEKMGTPVNEKFFIQVDLEKASTSCALDKKILPSLVKGIALLKSLSYTAKTTVLADFRASFESRFGMQEVPLLHALDPEIGIPYGLDMQQIDPSPLIDDLMMPELPEHAPETNWDPPFDMLLEKYTEAINNDLKEIMLQEKDLGKLEPGHDDLPATFNVCFRIVEACKEHTQVPAIELLWAGGPGAANVMGRFCHINKDLYELAREINSHESRYYPGCILAEVLHLPEERTGNILQRPLLRDYEIPCMARAGVPPDKQIPLNDLNVSVRGNEVILRSKRHNKRVLPRMSSAHNYNRNTIPVYRFLCDLQTQGIHDNLSFSWGPLGSRFNYFPRVSCDNLVISPETWVLKEKAIGELSEILGNQDPSLSLNEWRLKYKIPPLVVLAEYDNELPVSFSNQSSAALLLGHVAGRKEIILKECLFDAGNTTIKGVAGNYNHEIIAPFFIKIPAHE